MEVKNIFSPETVEQREVFLAGIWKGEATEKIAFQIVGEAYSKDRKKRPCTIKETQNEPDKYLAIQLDNHRCRLDYDDYSIPLVVPFPSVLTVATAFGCNEVWESDNASPDAAPVLANAGDVDNLKMPSMNDGLVPQALAAVEYFVKEVGDTYPIRAINHQGPFANAMYIFGYENIMLQLYDHSREVHKILEMVTEFMIKFINEQKRRVPWFLPTIVYPDWIPQNYGLGIADDFVAVLSPDFYEEFCIPYNNILSDEFNGIHIHSCGDFRHNYQNLLKHRKLRGVNFEASDNDIAAVVDTFSGKAVIAPHPGIHASDTFGNMVNYIKTFLELKRPDTRVHLTIEGGTFDSTTGTYSVDKEDIDAAAKLLKQYNNSH